MTWIDADDAVTPDYLADYVKSAMTQHTDAIPCDLVIAKNLCVYESGEQCVIGELDDAVYDVKDYVPHVLPRQFMEELEYFFRLNLSKRTT